jgi:hypothetical protein
MVALQGFRNYRQSGLNDEQLNNNQRCETEHSLGVPNLPVTANNLPPVDTEHKWGL